MLKPKGEKWGKRSEAQDDERTNWLARKRWVLRFMDQNQKKIRKDDKQHLFGMYI